MKPIPLNTKTRQLILNAMLRRMFHEKHLAAEKAVADAFEVWYREHVLTEEQEAIVKTLPSGLFRWVNHVRYKTDYTGPARHYELNRYYPMLVDHLDYQDVGSRSFKGNDILFPAVRAREAVFEEQAAKKVEFENFLNNFKNSKQLYDEWPEGKDLYKDIVARIPPVRNLPMVPVQVINDALGLP